MTQATAPATNITVKTPSSPLTILLLLAAGGFGLWWIGGKVKNYLEEKEGEKAGSDPDVQVAQRIRNAIQGAGTDLEGLYQAAADVHDYVNVAKAYKKTYHTTIEDDMRGERAITAEVQKKFFDIIKTANDINSGKPYVQPTSGQSLNKGAFVLAKSNSWVRKTPKAINPTIGSANRIKMAKAGELVGVATGKIIQDAAEHVKFIEVQIFISDTKKSVIAYVASGNTEVKNVKSTAELGAHTTFTATQKEFDSATSLSGTTDDVKRPYRSPAIIVATNDTILRRTPLRLAEGQSGDNRIRTAQKGQAIGIATGRFSKDEISNTVFYEMKCLEAGKPNSPGLNVWAEKKDIEFVQPQNFSKRTAEFTRNGSIILLPKEEWQNGNSIRRISDAPDFDTEIITSHKTEISEEMTSHVAKVDDGIILGHKIMEVKSPKGTRVKFQSLNGINWWVNKNDVKEVRK